MWTVKTHLLRAEGVGPGATARMLVMCHMLLAFFHNVLLVQRRDLVTAAEALVAAPPRAPS